KNCVPKLLEKPVNHFQMDNFSREDAQIIVDHIVEAMKKGLLRGWTTDHNNCSRAEDKYEKMAVAVLDIHPKRPPFSFWYDCTWFSQDFSEKVRLARENWKPLMEPGVHSIEDSKYWLHYMC
uniref:TIR domain-containing protein n=1 Tax=Steinernema glaseri TaxID=37863 RepID=A0A1I8A1A0_9BILA